ncbi:hypothetical protein BaRGS_00020513 [Batillaria attramentaria]|uniref:Beta-1,3-galactosyl-O-glycosyl-glycoprotein beta-1,6-N-acetylglucosaminyltransferase n=1 Tax=Batillaria attramentaria TaxID=370345 RepID=A0ABD0KM85_9CAEN
MVKGMIQRGVNALCQSPNHRVLRQRLLVTGFFLLTLLVIMARLDAEADLRLEANTLVLPGGFPALHVNNVSAKLLSSLQQHSLTRTTAPLVVRDLKMAKLANAQKRKWAKSHFVPPLWRGEKRPSCARLISGDVMEQARAKDFMERHKRLEKTPLEYVREARNCSRFIEERGYIMAATPEERSFPIAYSIMMYTGVEQTERLLRAIYRPHNYHCIHVDLKSGEEIMAAMRAIAGCLPNVFIASRLNKVYWATYSSLEALLFCMDDLWKASGTWKYYINLTGQEFPLKTNLQIVRILQALNGSNIVDASTDP